MPIMRVKSLRNVGRNARGNSSKLRVPRALAVPRIWRYARRRRVSLHLFGREASRHARRMSGRSPLPRRHRKPVRKSGLGSLRYRVPYGSAEIHHESSLSLSLLVWPLVAIPLYIYRAIVYSKKSSGKDIVFKKIHAMHRIGDVVLYLIQVPREFKK